MGRLVERFTDKKLVIAGTVALAAGMFLLPLSSTVVALLASTATVAIGHGLAAAPLNGLASRKAGEGAQGRVLGRMQSMASLARIVGPVLGGWLLNLDLQGPAAQFGRSPYWVSGGVLVAAAVTALTL
jgi:DHA1 family tetracycline resistance protein-like MFS transporter